jgi:hypothetical protein
LLFKSGNDFHGNLQIANQPNEVVKKLFRVSDAEKTFLCRVLEFWFENETTKKLFLMT